MSCYIFYPEIFRYLEKLKPSPRGEYELTDAIRNLINNNYQVYALNLCENTALDIGTPYNLMKAIRLSFNYDVLSP